LPRPVFVSWDDLGKPARFANDLRSDKFQAYVLQEVFTRLVQGASARLLMLTQERYSLQFHDDEIRVVDHDNADETRVSDTFSGGETFLTSLALVLEFSDQIQRAVGAVNLDSLFIDEGFGTLDPDTLVLVSEPLQSLRVGGQMVGIITHIPELRDEFAQQVIMTKHQGCSTVEVRGRRPAGAADSFFFLNHYCWKHCFRAPLLEAILNRHIPRSWLSLQF
jgi:DNA repair exonuclease SbcCD ATPase subunit